MIVQHHLFRYTPVYSWDGRADVDDWEESFDEPEVIVLDEPTQFDNVMQKYGWHLVCTEVLAGHTAYHMPAKDDGFFLMTLPNCRQAPSSTVDTVVVGRHEANGEFLSHVVTSVIEAIIFLRGEKPYKMKLGGHRE